MTKESSTPLLILKTGFLISTLLTTNLACAAEPFEYVSKESRDCNNIAKQIKYARPKIKGFKDSRIQGFKDSRIQGFKDSRIQGFKDSRIILIYGLAPTP